GALVEKNIGAYSFKSNYLRVDSRLRGIVGEFCHNHALRCLGAKAVFESLDIVATRIVVLVENADLALRQVLHDVFCIDPPLGLIGRLPSHSPRKALPFAELGGAGGDEELRHLLHIHVWTNGIVGRCTEALEDEQYFIAL